MATFNKFDIFALDILLGHHDLTTSASGTLTIALCTNANAPVAGDSILGDLIEIAYTNVVTTPTASRVIGNPTSIAQVSGVAKLVLPDMTITATGGAIATFRHIVLYNDTPTTPLNPLIGWIDYGSDLTLAQDESLVIDFDDAGGLFTVT